MVRDSFCSSRIRNQTVARCLAKIAQPFSCVKVERVARVDEVVKEVELESEPERAWRAISEESELSEWLGGEVDVDLVPGGEISVQDEAGDRTGFVESVDEGRGIAFWWSVGEEESTRVELEVISDPDREGCVVRVTESRPLAGLERELSELTALASVA